MKKLERGHFSVIKGKQILSIFIIAAIIFATVFSSISTADVGNLLPDIEGHWAQGTVEGMINEGIIKGYPDGTFKPNNNITRAEFTSLLVRAFNLESGPGKVFSDTANHWAKDHIKTANYHGLVNGYSDTLFGPNDPVTREQIAVMVVNATKVELFDESKTFIDSAQISAWAKEPVAKAAAAGLIVGYPDGTFKPKANATRAEAAVILARSMKLVTDEEIIMVFDTAGIYGPEDGVEIIEADVVINADGVILRNTIIKEDLIISEKVGDGDVTLNNVTVKGTTSIQGGGKDSIYINGGQYNNIIIEGTPGGNVRIVAVDAKGIKIAVSEKAAGEEIILEGTFESVEIKSNDIILSTQGKTDINKIKVHKNLSSIKLNVDESTTINELTLDSVTEVKNAKDTVKKIGGDKAPDSDIDNPPKEETPSGPISGGGGGYTPPGKTDINNVSIEGVPIVGQVLTATVKPLGATADYQWQKADKVDGTYEDIDEAISKTYELIADDANQYIRVVSVGKDNYKGTVTSGPVGPIVDKTALQAKVDEAAELNEENYTAESWADFAAALADAQDVLDNEEAAQEQVDEALAVLTAAIDGLVEIEEPPTEYTLTLEANPTAGGTVTGSGDYAEGAEVEITAEANEGYKFINWTIDGEELSTDASFTYTMSSNDVTLVANFEEIEEPEVDKTALQAKVDEAAELNKEDYTKESWATLQEALNAANTVLADDEATQEQVDTALVALEAAIDGLVKIEEPPVVDKTALQAKVDEAAGLDKEDYTTETWAAFATVLENAQAVLADEKATQDEVDDVLLALITAITGLELKEPVATVTLEIDPTRAKIGDEIALDGDADPNTFVLIKVVDSKGNIVYFDAVKSDSNGKYNTTFIVPDVEEGKLTIVAGYGENVAVKILEITDGELVDKTALQAKVDEAAELNEENYTAESWADFAAALADAQDVLDNEEAAQEQVDDALAVLTAAIDGLVEIEEPEVDKTALQAKVDEAAELNKEDYTKESWATLQEALNAANTVLADDEATQEQVDTALVALEAAIDGLVKIEEPPVVDKTALQAKVDEAAGLDKEDYTTETWAAFATVLENAQAVLADEKATQDEVDDVLLALITAITGLELKEPVATVTLEIDPTRARIGDEITLNGNADPNIFVSIKVVDESGKIVYFDGVKSGSDGKYNTTFIVPDDIKGNLTIVAGYGTNVDVKTLKIIDGEPEVFDKVKFIVGSGDTEVTAVMDSEYVIKAVIPKGAGIDAGEATLTLEMTDIASLGITGTRSHELTIKTGIEGFGNVRLDNFIKHVLNLTESTINSKFGNNEVTYIIGRADTDVGNNWVMVPDEIDSARDAWQYLVGAISTQTFTGDDSQIFIPEGAYLIIGDKKLVFESNLDLTNVTGDLEVTEQDIRDAVVLKDAEGEGVDAQIAIFMPKCAKLRIGQSQITLEDSLLTKINDLNIEQEKLNAVLSDAQESTGAYGIVLGSLDILNLMAEGMQNANITVEVQRTGIQESVTYFDEL